jgi:biotin transporter BioY
MKTLLKKSTGSIILWNIVALIAGLLGGRIFSYFLFDERIALFSFSNLFGIITALILVNYLNYKHSIKKEQVKS